MLSEPLLVVAMVAAVLETLGVPYVVGGSLASSLHGIPRATQDVDLVAQLRSGHGERLVAALEQAFYIDAAAVHNAIHTCGSFNVIHLATMFKADIFVPPEDPWIESELQRARIEVLEYEGRAVPVRFASPEDVLLHKLVWFRMGDEVSDRQWRDVLGVLKVQAEQLDLAYLACWSRHLGVRDLLDRARQETR